MKFGPVPLDRAEGAILAHSMVLPDGRLRKGDRLGAADIARLRAAGQESVTVAHLGPDDVPEDEAAARVAAALAPDAWAAGLTVSAPFTGRVNLHAAADGLLRVDGALVDRLNALDEAVTLATMPDRTWLRARAMAATVKIIPYAAPRRAVEAAEALLAGQGGGIRLRPPVRTGAALILTRTPGMADKLVAKARQAVAARLSALGVTLAEERIVPHRTEDLAAALAGTDAGLVLILTGSATSDRHDVGPAALVAAGGVLERFGMPVDPGNLLFCGRLGGRPVIGLPGCARSPALNGADWVLERTVAGEDVAADQIAGMGVGGLLKEIPSRPQPRGGAALNVRPRIGAVVLAAGASRRMGGRDKLLETVGGQALLARVAAACRASGVDETIVVLRPGDEARAAALAGLPVRLQPNPRAAEGMGTSIAAGVSALAAGTDAAIVIPGDMPGIGAAEIDRLIAAFDVAEGREIVRARAGDGRPGHPVLFGRRFFEPLRALGGDEGARAIVAAHPDYVVDVTLPGAAALTDLDTPEDWARWRAANE